MAPLPQEGVMQGPDGHPLKGEEVVISGMSGIFPSSDSVKQFQENLYNNVDMVQTNSTSRWVFRHPEVPPHIGTVNGMGKFDAQFFRVHYKQACTMEPMSRKLLEHAYSAIYDSGINPLQLRGTKVGVFIGSTFSESEKIVIYETIQRNGFGITGCNKAMYANRISYWIDGKGPSYALDLASASSMACLEHAYRSISSGQCDAAIVGGCNLCMHPCISLNMKRAGFLCHDGKTKSFDKNGDGYARSDAISVLFIQKAKDAKRIYSEVFHAKETYGLTEGADFSPIRNSDSIKQFLDTFYKEINISPSDVEFVEGYGIGIAEADKNELKAIGQVFGKENPVMVGSVTSNMGHSEPASGVCALIKVCLAYQEGKLPANLHYSEPQTDVEAVREGRVQVLKEATAFNRGYAALNSFSHTGANIHVLLKGHYKKKDPNRYKSTIPYVVLVSGRQESSVDKILTELKNHPLDAEEIGLIHSIHENEIPGHMCRGYSILGSDENSNTVSLAQHLEYFNGLTRKVWFVYSGMGSQWAGMGAELMRIPIFAAAIEKCRKVLEPKGIDIVHILTNPDKTVYDNILHSFVGIAAVQIGLTDILRKMGIVPDKIIGHSVGELGCAYADGCFTAEEMILSAYSRGLVSVQTPLIRGSMAAVGLGYKEVLPMCPPEIEVACHNSSESSTISGPAEVMKEFVASLTEKGIFAREVPCSNIAYHSRYIAGAGDGLRKYLSEVITNPKPRSDKWVSTSVPQEKWELDSAKYSSPEYHTNNLLNPVLFEEAAQLIPSDALIIEVAPHGLLQAILKRSHPECINIPLTRRGHADPVKFFLESIGKLYESGFNPDVRVLYPKIEFPVSTGTPLLSHYVDWVHTEEWPQAKYNSKDKMTAAVRDFVISIHDDDYKYLEGYIRNGNNVFPESALLEMVWETFAMQRGMNYKDLSVVFSDVKFERQAFINRETPLRLGLMIHQGSNRFEIRSEGCEIVHGIIKEWEKPKTNRDFENLKVDDNNQIFTSNDIYRILHAKGHSYSEDFSEITSANKDFSKAQIKKSGNWVKLLESIIQLSTLAKNYNTVAVPTLIKTITINMEEHNQYQNSEESTMSIEVYKLFESTKCGGIIIDGINFTEVPLYTKNAIIRSREFIPHVMTGEIDIEKALDIQLQIVADNTADNVINLTMSENIPSNLRHTLENISLNSPVDIKIVTADEFLKKSNNQNSNVFIFHGLLEKEKKAKELSQLLPASSFVLSVEENTTVLESSSKHFNVISKFSSKNRTTVLMKKIQAIPSNDIIFIPVEFEQEFSWVKSVKNELQSSKKVVLISDRQPYCGLLGLVKALRKEFGNKISLVVIDDFCSFKFSPSADIFQEQIQKNIIFNVLKKGIWGSFYEIPVSTASPVQNVSLTSTEPGNLDSLKWSEVPKITSSGCLVQVCCAGPTVSDAEKAIGKITSDDEGYGMDFSGIDYKGDRVMGLVKSGALSTTIEADPNLLWPVPEHWTLEEAATVPQPYVRAYYCLMFRSRLHAGSTVLVHGGTGALGQAVISICLALNCRVFTTVSDLHKKRFLLKLFPQLNEKDIGNSRDTTFETMVKENTNLKRCDIVINCTSGMIRNASMKCCGFSAYFLDLNQKDIAENNDFGMEFLYEEKSYKAVRFDSIFADNNTEIKTELQAMIAEGIAKGLVRPLSKIVFSPSDISRAFRLLSLSRHRGRVIIKVKELVSQQNIDIVPRVSYNPKATYVVVCGQNYLGIELANRLVRKGARRLMIHISPDLKNGYLDAKVELWQQAGATVKISTENLESEKGCVSLIHEAKRMSSIEGVFVTQICGGEKPAKSVTEDDFLKQFRSFMIVANMDLVSRNICNDLKYFVVVTQTSQDVTIAYRNSITEKLCRQRVEVGFPALYLNVEKLDEFGKTIEDDSKLGTQSINAAINSLETSLKLKQNNVVSYNMKPNYNEMFLKKISKVLGISDVNELSENLTLSELSISDVNIEEIKLIVKSVTGLMYSTQMVESLNILSLKSLVQTGSHQNTKFDSGLGAFYTFVEEDECLATEPIVVMPTKLTSHVTETEEEQEVDADADYFLLVPGFEGHHQVFRSVCERLKSSAVTLQLGPDVNDSVPQMAANIWKFMKNRFPVKSRFYLMGYSFGVNVALELAALIEKEGHVGVLFCLDSSPDALRSHLDAYLGNFTNNELQNKIVEHMYQLMTGETGDEIQADLKSAEEWSQKVQVCVDRIKGRVPYSHQYVRCTLETAFKRIVLAREYKPDIQLKSEIILLRGLQHPNAAELAEDYGLGSYSQLPVKIFQLNSDHATAPEDCRVSNIMNRHLSNEILEVFKNKNLCETYLADPFKIL